MEILPASLLDLNALRKLSQACFGSDAWSLFDQISVLTFANVIRLKAVQDNNMLGFIAGDMNHRNGQAWISILAVDPAYQRRGVGTALLRACEEQMKSPFLRLTVRISNQSAIALYEKEGYRSMDIWKNYYSDGEDGLVMMKNS